MATFNTSGNRFGLEYVPSSFLLRFGRREIFIGRDVRTRFYPVRPILDCRIGNEPGYIEFVLMQRWLIVFSKTR
jgi:hypothetical protein